jgi:TrmH family RNA methyltransferase
LLILDGIQDPGNLGTILRTAAAAGVSGVLLTTGTVDLYNEKVLRATMGSIFHLPMRQNVDPQELVDVCSRERLPLILADPRSTRPYFHWDFTSRMALVIGNESTGPGEILRMAATETVVIPMPGQLESLNAAVAAGILLFERVRQSF